MFIPELPDIEDRDDDDEQGVSMVQEAKSSADTELDATSSLREAGPSELALEVRRPECCTSKEPTRNRKATGKPGKARRIRENDDDADAEEYAGPSGPKIRRRRWSPAENHMVFQAFGKEITNKVIPDGSRLAELARRMGSGRTVAQLRAFIHNYISGKTKSQ